MLTTEKKEVYINRIIALEKDDKAIFGQMNVSQMICHCSDLFRVMFGEMDGLKEQKVDIAKLRELSMRNETIPTLDGLDQMKGEGTKATTFENDKNILIGYLERFHDVDEKFKFPAHPYWGELNKIKWGKMLIYHLNHHLKQFGR